MKKEEKSKKRIGVLQGKKEGKDLKTTDRRTYGINGRGIKWGRKLRE